MSEALAKNLGQPDIQLSGLQLWVHGRQFQDSDDYWDGNWLLVTAHCGSADASVRVTGPIIHLSELHRWHSESIQLQTILKGEAKLECMEPELAVTLKAETSGHITMEVSITPDPMNQKHWFQFMIDQSYLGLLVKQCVKILQTYPIKGNQPEMNTK